jgi:predicted permease
VLVALQMALCLAAIVAAGLLVRSVERLKAMDLGFDRDHVVYVTVSPAGAGYSADRFAGYAERVGAALAKLPGVVGVSPLATRPLSGDGNAIAAQRPGRPPKFNGPMPDAQEVTHLNAVGEGFFETLGIPLLVGRTFAAADFAPDADAVIVDELFVRRFFPGEDPIGKRVGLGRNPAESSRYSIVGVVGNSRYNSMRNDLMPTFYQPFRARGTINFAIRSTMAAAPLADAVRKAVASVDPSVPVTEFHTQSALIDRTLRTERLLGLISAALGVIALTIAAIGLAGLLAYVVARRRAEIGLRVALGASARDVVRMVLADCGWLVGAGILLGVPCAYGVARLLRTSLFQLEPFDVPTTAAACAVLCAVALAAAWLPARRAAGIDPITALRQE